MLTREVACWRLGVALGLLALLACGERDAGEGDVAKLSSGAPSATLSKVEARAERDATVWADEVSAQRYEAPIVAFWDRLRRAPDKLTALASAPFETLSLAELTPPQDLEHGVQRRAMLRATGALDAKAIAAMATELVAQGFALIDSEWHHSRFEPARAEQLARSTVSFALHVTREELAQRMILRGELEIEWSSVTQHEPQPQHVRVTKLERLQRTGEVVFEELAAWPAPASGPRPGLAEPILLQDLDGNGFTDIVLANANLVQLNQGDGNFRAVPLCEPEIAIDAALLADLNGDGVLDLLAAASGELPQLFTHRELGRFVMPQAIDAVVPLLQGPMAITAGDIDADGDLDVFLAQYKLPYVNGQMPTPFYNANDGHHSYLLVNLGDGRFIDGTQAAGLAAKRLRRSYSTSFVDLDDDADLDLLVVSDFAGFDVYLNDGSGHFSDVTQERFGAGHNTFGMAHALADLNADGQLDFLVVGMSSTTARRLDQLGLGRDDARDYRALRAVMGYGNRLYLGTAQGRYELAPNNDSLARTGWSWGTATFDLENDGDRELFIANGHLSGESASDYCSTFWTHDLYDGNSAPDPEVRALFASSMAPLVSGKRSWNGYEKNALLQRVGDAWINTAFLFGIAHSYDARAAVSADFDNDGRTDLLVVERTQLPERHDVVHLYANRWPTPGNWLGVRLASDLPDVFTLGATLQLTDSAGRTHVHHVVSGDSHRAQHDSSVIFGLGSAQAEQLEVRWPDGRRKTLKNLPRRSYLLVKPIAPR